MPDTNNAKLPARGGQELGGSGTYFFKGYITSEEYSIDLQGKYGLQVYDVMRKSDPTIHAILQVCKQPILGANWEIEPASDDPIDIEVADRANHEFFNRNLIFTDIMREGLSFLEFGFYTGELVYEVAQYDNKPYIGFKKISSRKQRSVLKFETDDGQPGITQTLPNSAKTANIPRNKLLLVVNDQEGENYFGTSMLRYAYKPWKIKDALELMNAVALENLGMGVPYIKKGIDGISVDETELAKVRDRLRQQRANEEAFLEWPAGVEVGWTDMKGNTTKDILPTIEYQDRQITLTVLAQFLELGQQGGTGSRAVSEDHSRLFVKSLIAVARTWQQAFQRDVLNTWVDLNYSNLKNGYPKLIFSTISDEDVTDVSNAVGNLMNAGALQPDRDIENRMRTLLNLPQLAKDDYDNYEKPPKGTPLVDAAGNPIMPTKALPDASGAPKTPDKTKTDIPIEDKNAPVEATAERIIENAKAIHKQVFELLARR